VAKTAGPDAALLNLSGLRPTMDWMKPRCCHGSRRRQRRTAAIGVPWSDLMKTYMCVICGLIFDEAEGWPDDGIPPGTRWEDVPLNWKCPECGAGKDDFEMVEV